MFNGKIHYKWQFSIAMLNYQRVTSAGHGNPKLAMKKLEASDRASGQGQLDGGPWNLVLPSERLDMYCGLRMEVDWRIKFERVVLFEKVEQGSTREQERQVSQQILQDPRSFQQFSCCLSDPFFRPGGRREGPGWKKTHQGAVGRLIFSCCSVRHLYLAFRYSTGAWA